ncbi:hypothetical protein D9619_003620 [Psilocybe cf. subviscida]|uniref:DUF6593 domain-containing protein n=1 Tax=Psilocybe cf. subviscida TaxID=2480587 RepID=A0A8H5EU87_9AGAR|nr:hypothetical protein D9619_003620 [Psilocybe cf. subviscida]
MSITAGDLNSAVPLADLDFNGSQATLVNPSPPSRLVFSTPSPTNATLYLNSRPFFRVLTKNPASGSTKIIDQVSGDVVSTLKRRSLQPDTIQFKTRYDGRRILVRDWLKERVDPDGKSMWIIETPVGAFAWRSDMAFRLVLTPETDSSQLIAWVELPGSETGSNLALALTRGTESFWEEIVASFCFIEQKLRWKEKLHSRSVGKSMIIPM